MWQETVYGEDRYGHPMVLIEVAKIDTDALMTLPSELIERLVTTLLRRRTYQLLA